MKNTTPLIYMHLIFDIPQFEISHLMNWIFFLSLNWIFTACSHLSNNRGGWNKRGWGAKVAKSIFMEVGINVEGGIFWKKLVHKCNKRGVEGGKNLRNQ